ncbi:hypothetical protein DFP72DRAFT_807320 [Ephemerocybe angulata]|uniref:RING-type domain-containing protein n=1 Tax=Ephemerocybe angulata TaxID=980116 RepID=A0A8H6I6Y4_9AGAR|nr:hypothetical protein DFP72DRAFT_807320 [Tulosesus angulatus]
MDHQGLENADSNIVHALLNHVFVVLPDANADPDYVLELILQSLPTYGPDDTVALVVQFLLDSASTQYPPHSTLASIDCQCCFTSFPEDEISKCPAGHPFCKSCIQQYIATQLGDQRTDISCMYSSDDGCQLAFSPSILRACLTEDLLLLYERLSQQKDLQEAQIEGLEDCPFCDFACVMDIPLLEVPTFSCQNTEKCGRTSCRVCRTEAHPGRPCDNPQNKVRETRLDIEEAMTRALLRHCPKCSFSFIKSDGCNKMKCPNCSTISCYICRQAILDVNYYDHFVRISPPYLACIV